MININKLINVC